MKKHDPHDWETADLTEEMKYMNIIENGVLKHGKHKYNRNLRAEFSEGCSTEQQSHSSTKSGLYSDVDLQLPSHSP